MKFLEDRELAQLNNFLSHVNLGDHEVTGQLENYSCTFYEYSYFVCFAFVTFVRLFLFLFSASTSERTWVPLMRRETRWAHFLLTLSLHHTYHRCLLSSFSEYYYKTGKLAGQDKKNFGAIETDVVEELSSSPNLY